MHIYSLLLSLGLASGISLDISLGNACNTQISEISILGYSAGTQETVYEIQQSPRTHGFNNPQYYSIRLGVKKYEIELVHHKLYFDETLPDGISHLEITDGYNLLMANTSSEFHSVKELGSFHYRLGIGTVVAHPDITINGNRYFTRGGGLVPAIWRDGYHLGGFSSQLAAFYKKHLSDGISVHLEIKLIYAHASISLDATEDIYERFDIKIPNYSFHFLGGISFGK